MQVVPSRLSGPKKWKYLALFSQPRTCIGLLARKKCSHSRLESVSDCADYRHQPVAAAPPDVITAPKFGLGFVFMGENVAGIQVGG